MGAHPFIEFLLNFQCRHNTSLIRQIHSRISLLGNSHKSRDHFPNTGEWQLPPFHPCGTAACGSLHWSLVPSTSWNKSFTSSLCSLSHPPAPSYILLQPFLHTFVMLVAFQLPGQHPRWGGWWRVAHVEPARSTSRSVLSKVCISRTFHLTSCFQASLYLGSRLQLRSITSPNHVNFEPCPGITPT